MNHKQIARLALGASLALVLAPSAFATGTDADVNITNTASVNYDVGGIDQPDITSTTDNFEVDRKIIFTVTDNGNHTVTPGATAQQLTFTVTNNTNGTVDFYLTTEQSASDNFDGSGTVKFYLDDGDGVFEPNDGAGPSNDQDGSPITFLNNIAEDAAPKVHVVYDIPSPLTDGNIATVHLIATAATDGSDATNNTIGANAYAETGSDTAAAVDTVLADAAGSATGDTARNAQHSDSANYVVDSANLTISKTSRVVTDPVNCTVAGDSTSCSGGNPKRIPGAVVQYCITVANAAAAATAENVVITDAMPTNTTYVAGSIWTNVTGATTVCNLTDTLTASGNLQPEDDNATDNSGDEADPAGGSFSANTVTVQLKPDVGASGIARASFRVTID